MNILIANEARKNLYRLIDEVADNHQPAIIKGKRNSAVLIAAEDWEDIVETITVASNKELSDSLLKGIKTPYSKCSKTLD